MMKTPDRRQKPYLAVSWLAKILYGTNHCRWAVWHRMHFWFNKVDHDFTESNIRHNELRLKLLYELETRDCDIRLERKIEYEGKRVFIQGSIDLLAINGERGVVYEVKSGNKSPADKAQLMIYMWLLPRVYTQYENIRLDGILVYENEHVFVHAEEINDAFTDFMKNMIVKLLDEEPARKYPSLYECRFCNIADCDEKITEPVDEEPSSRIPDFL